MLRIKLSLGRFFVIAAVALLLLPAASIAQTEEDPGIENPDSVPVEETTTNANNPPPYIHDLVENSELTTEQVDLMRTDGYGWGNIKLATELAEKISAQSQGTDNPITFSDALTQVMNDRSQDIGFGEIAAKYGLKIGELNRHSNQLQAANTHGPRTEKPARLEKPVKLEKMEKPERPEKPAKPEKPEKPEMMGRGPQR